MRHFGVENHTDRDVHEFFLEFEERRIENYGETLEHLLEADEDRDKVARFELVEQVTAGGH